MGNYWLDLFRLKDIADELKSFLINKALGAKYHNAQKAVEKFVEDFWDLNPEISRFKNRLFVEIKIVKDRNGGSTVTNIIVEYE